MKLLLIFLLTLSSTTHAQVIDAEKYIKTHGYMKRVKVGQNLWFTTYKKVSLNEILARFENVKQMPQTKTAREMCEATRIGAIKIMKSDGRKDIEIDSSFGFGGPVDNTIACILFFQRPDTVTIVGGQVYYMTLAQNTTQQEIYTLIVTH